MCSHGNRVSWQVSDLVEADVGEVAEVDAASAFPDVEGGVVGDHLGQNIQYGLQAKGC